MGVSGHLIPGGVCFVEFEGSGALTKTVMAKDAQPRSLAMLRGPA